MNNRLLKLRQKLLKGQLSLGTWMAIGSPTIAEIIANAGFDWVVIDSEHNPMNEQTLLYMLMAFRGSDTVPIIRVAYNDPVLIKKAIDMGFEGIITPNTNTVDEVKKAISAVRYPPMGRRGFGPTRPSNYFRDGGKYADKANESIICCVQIEDICALKHLDKIVKLSGFDWILIGPNDLSGTMGVFRQPQNPKVQKVMEKIVKTAHENKIPVGIPMADIGDINKYINMGCQLFPVGQDVNWLSRISCEIIEEFTKVVSKSKK